MTVTHGDRSGEAIGAVLREADEERLPVQTAVDKALVLLEVFAGNEIVGVSEVARRAGLSKSTAFRLLQILLRNGFVERYGNGYALGRVLFDLGARVYERYPGTLRELLMPFLTELYESTHETVHLAVLRGTEVVYLEKLYGHRRAPSPSRVGARLPAHITAVGKVLLSYAPDSVEPLRCGGLRRYTPNTVVDPGRLMAELDRARVEGVAYDEEEAAVGLRCVAAPVLSITGQPVAALSVAGASGRFEPARAEYRLRSIAGSASALIRGALGQPSAEQAMCRVG